MAGHVLRARTKSELIARIERRGRELTGNNEARLGDFYFSITFDGTSYSNGSFVKINSYVLHFAWGSYMIAAHACIEADALIDAYSHLTEAERLDKARQHFAEVVEGNVDEDDEADEPFNAAEFLSLSDMETIFSMAEPGERRKHGAAFMAKVWHVGVVGSCLNRGWGLGLYLVFCCCAWLDVRYRPCTLCCLLMPPFLLVFIPLPPFFPSNYRITDYYEHGQHLGA